MRFILYITKMSPTPLGKHCVCLKNVFDLNANVLHGRTTVCVCVRDVCVVYIFMRRMYCYIYTQYFIYLYFLTTYSAPFERFNGHLLTNCKCFGLLSASAASAAAAAVRWFSERNQSDVYNKFTVIYAYKNCTAINFRVCGGRSSGFACSDSPKKTPKSRVKCENYLGVWTAKYPYQ